MAFYGDDLQNITIDSSFVPILLEVGIIQQKDQKEIRKEILSEEITRVYTLNDLPELISSRKDISEYIEKGPLIIVPPSEDKDGAVLVPHELIQAPSRQVREKTIKYLMRDKSVSLYTKKLIKN